MVMMEEPGGRFASGLFRRTGGAGSATARGGDRKVSGGLDPIPIQRRTAWATRLARVRGEPARPGLLPHCDASRARPSKKRPSRYSRAYGRRQEQSENITLPAHFLVSLSRHHRACAGDLDCLRRRAFPDRDGRHEAGHDGVGGMRDGVIPGRSKAEGKGNQIGERGSGCPSRPFGHGDDTQHVVGAGWPDEA